MGAAARSGMAAAQAVPHSDTKADSAMAVERGAKANASMEVEAVDLAVRKADPLAAAVEAAPEKAVPDAAAGLADGDEKAAMAAAALAGDSIRAQAWAAHRSLR